jgi:hypothetical protein
MGLSISQYPSSASLSQSPIIFSFKETGAVITSSSFQYMLDLYYWTGSQSGSGSAPEYTLVKYPNASDSGIFDVSRIMNSELNKLAEEPGVTNAKWFKARLYWQYQSGSVFVTTPGGGEFFPDYYGTQPYYALDGYQLFPEAVNANIVSSSVTNFGYSLWPLMTDGPKTQSILADDYISNAVFIGNVGATQCTYLVTQTSNGTTFITPVAPAASGSSNDQIEIFNNSPSSFLYGTLPFSWYNVIPAYRSGATYFALSPGIRFNIVCDQKYPNVRIKWKNRFGQFDWFDFNMVNKQAFQVNRSQYQPQIGTWNSNTLTYRPYDSSIVNYLVDTKQSISVNTDWVDEDYNEIFKQLLVSDEIYWINDPDNYVPQYTGFTPITIKTESIQFKTGVVDKVIQYQFDFDYGQGYKLIL